VRDMLTPRRKRGVEILDSPDVDPGIVTRSLTDVARANALFGGISSALGEVREALKEVPHDATLLDVGTGLGDIPCRAREEARRNGIELTTIGLDSALELASASRCSIDFALCADALRLPFADNSIDIGAAARDGPRRTCTRDRERPEAELDRRGGTVARLVSPSISCR
jgi:hypothetical protein